MASPIACLATRTSSSCASIVGTVDADAAGRAQLSAHEHHRLMTIKVGIPIGDLAPVLAAEVTAERDRLVFESVRLPEHLVMPVVVAGSPFAGETHTAV